MAVSFFLPLVATGAPLLMPSPATTAAGQVAKEFFTNFFMNPGASMILPILFCAIIIVAVVGIAYLAKKYYQKKCETPTPDLQPTPGDTAK